MIVVRLTGGLGNQMFQYAAAFALARRRGTILKLDLGHLAGPRGTPRSYALGALSVTAGIAAPREAAERAGYGRTRLETALVRARRALRPPSPPPRLVEERSTRFDPAILDAPDGSYLVGCWQSERYFADAAREVRREFAVAAPPAGRNLEAAERIRSAEAVAVHVRRGDYADDPATRATHGTLGAGYYRACCGRLAGRVADPRLFVFSDDPAWVRRHLAFPLPAEIVDHNPPERAHEDLRLMTLCRHHVIANSSLSWWGAWLCGHPGKIVLAPARWFLDPARDDADLLPPSWERV